MKAALDRARFRPEWQPVVLFALLVTLPTLWIVFKPTTELQANIGTMGASLVIAGIGWWFLRRERIRARDVGLDGRHWLEGVALFIGWWLLMTLIDLVGSQVARMLGQSLVPVESLDWSPAVLLEWIKAWIFVGIAEEIAFRAYVHNKLVTVLDHRWLAIALAALIFGLWHLPGSIIAGRFVPGTVLAALVVSVLSLVLFNLTYEWTGLLPFLALFHGWSDFPLIATLRRPTTIGAVAGYLLVPVVLWAYRRLVLQPRQVVHMQDNRHGKATMQ
jgi:membrane protease YdiL (CAAX protease family)